MTTQHITGEWSEQDWYGVVKIDGTVLSPAASQQVYNHSPDGFAWGYAGSGPAQLALAIVLAAGVPEKKATRIYQQFRAAFISTLPNQAAFTLDVDVRAWAAQFDAQGVRQT